jgi:ribosome maturation factor RimP
LALSGFFHFQGKDDNKLGLAPFFCGCDSGGGMRVPERLTRLLEPVVTGLGYEMVGLEFDANQRILRVYIDQEAGVMVDDCSKVSHQISGVLDVEDPIPGNYHLEVSSPGMDRPLFKREHFQRFAGSLARLQLLRPLDGRRKFKARLQGLNGDLVILEEDGLRFEIPLDLIDKARLVPEFEQKNTKG